MNITTTYDEAMVKAMIAEAVAKEREECANVCDAFNSIGCKDDHWYHATEKCSEAIRARGQE